MRNPSPCRDGLLRLAVDPELPLAAQEALPFRVVFAPGLVTYPARQRPGGYTGGPAPARDAGVYTPAIVWLPAPAGIDCRRRQMTRMGGTGPACGCSARCGRGADARAAKSPRSRRKLHVQ